MIQIPQPALIMILEDDEEVLYSPGDYFFVKGEEARGPSIMFCIRLLLF